MRNRIKKIQGWLAASIMMLAAMSCSSSNEETTPLEPTTMPSKVVIYIPESTMQVNAATRAEGGFALRGVAEVYDPLGECVKHLSVMLTPTAQQDVYSFDLNDLSNGDYDIYVWADYSQDGGDTYYNTESLRGVTYKQDVVHNASDSKVRRAYFGKTALSPSSQTQPVKAKSPFAHYRIEAIDVDRYESMKNVNGWPELEELQIRVTYNSFVPTSFNILTGKPNDAETGVKYTANTFERKDGKVLVGDDFVFVTGEKSSVNITVELVNPANDEVISSIEDLRVDYREGYVTIVSGDFLTHYPHSDDVNVDVRWEGEYNVEF
jgi:hypothetical protein